MHEYASALAADARQRPWLERKKTKKDTSVGQQGAASNPTSRASSSSPLTLTVLQRESVSPPPILVNFWSRNGKKNDHSLASLDGPNMGNSDFICLALLCNASDAT